MKAYKTAYVGLLLIVVISGLSFFWEAPTLFVETLIGERPFWGAVAFVFLMFGATVVAPITVLPLVPLVSPVLGPFVTALLSLLGWTLGAVVAFLIARYAGRPILSRFVSLEAIDRYEKYIDPDARFWAIVMLRILIPVDVLSYALGIFSRVSLLEYTVASVIGISFFSFVFSYLGVAAIQENLYIFGSIVVVALSVLGLGWWYMVKKMRRRR